MVFQIVDGRVSLTHPCCRSRVLLLQKDAGKSPRHWDPQHLLAVKHGTMGVMESPNSRFNASRFADKCCMPLDLTTPKAYILHMYTFIETSIFERELPLYLDDNECAELQLYLMIHPDAGDVIPGSGGVRKLRWKRPGQGKRGGTPVVYFVRQGPREIWMLTIYAKAKQENIPPHILEALKEKLTHDQ